MTAVAVLVFFVVLCVVLGVVRFALLVMLGGTYDETRWVDPICHRCGWRIQPQFRSRVNWDGTEWVCMACLDRGGQMAPRNPAPPAQIQTHASPPPPRK